MGQDVQHQMMGYDRAITLFTPEGRLLQVEYAKKTVKQGSTAVGIRYANGVAIVSDKRLIDPLIIGRSVEKVFPIDTHLIAAAAGIMSDARVLAERARVKAQQHRVTYATPVDVVSIVKDVCDLKQITTQSGGYRPFGVSFIFAGVDATGPHVYETDPTGIFFEYAATVIGEGEEKGREYLHKEYREGLTREDALLLGIRVLKHVLGEDFRAERVDAAYVEESAVFLSEEEVQERVSRA